jgi:hypothetical protein
MVVTCRSEYITCIPWLCVVVGIQGWQGVGVQGHWLADLCGGVGVEADHGWEPEVAGVSWVQAGWVQAGCDVGSPGVTGWGRGVGVRQGSGCGLTV